MNGMSGTKSKSIGFHIWVTIPFTGRTVWVKDGVRPGARWHRVASGFVDAIDYVDVEDAIQREAEGRRYANILAMANRAWYRVLCSGRISMDKALVRQTMPDPSSSSICLKCRAATTVSDDSGEVGE